MLPVLKQALHSICLVAIVSYMVGSSGLLERRKGGAPGLTGWPYWWRVLVSSWPVFYLPTILAQGLGYLMVNCFPGRVQLRVNPDRLPTICFRVVTRGSEQNLIRKNVRLNTETCLAGGLRNFVFEVVTQLQMDLEEKVGLRQIVVPVNYATRKGSLYKARNLQYCLEESVNVLKDNDYVVHLDEDSLLTSDAVRGVANFVGEGKFDFGQGMVRIDLNGNLWSDIIESNVAYDLVVIPFLLKYFQRCFGLLKGTFFVCKVKAERDVSFDVGGGASLLEDVAFGLRADSSGYAFGYVEGCVREQGMLNLKASFHQRLRVFSGVMNIVFDSGIFRWKKCKGFILLMAYIPLIPLTAPAMLYDLYFNPISPCPFFLFCKALTSAVTLYAHLFLVLKGEPLPLLPFLLKASLSLTVGPILNIFHGFLAACVAWTRRNQVRFKVTPKMQ